MGEGTGRPHRRAGVLAAAVAAMALLAAACGGGGSSTGTGSTTGLTAYQKAIAFAECMRSHGVPRFPDPDNQGNFLINGRAIGPVSAAQFQRANRACVHLDPSTPLTPAQQRQALSKALRFAACMRAHGLPGFKDPTVGSQGIRIQGPPGFGPDSPQFRSAQQACRSLMPL